MRKLNLPIPTTIVTGHLGVGKTTALTNLLKRKPAEEHWCVIVNEFGAVGIDAIALQSSAAAAGGSVVVRQIAGGCMCCAQSGVLLPAIAQIIRQSKPDRLLIEPSGLGHPAGLLDILQGPHLGSSLQLNAIICLVDVSALDPVLLAQNPTAWDQVCVADILVGSKADAATPAAAAAFQQWASEELFPPKAQVLMSAHGHMDVSCLSAPRSAAATAGLLLQPSTRSSRARQQQHARLQQQPDAATTSSPSGSAAGAAGSAAITTPAEDLAADCDRTVAAEQQLARAEAQAGGPADAAALSSQPQPGMPQRVLGGQPPSSSAINSGDSSGGSALQHCSCGWVFHESDVFERQQLLNLLLQLQPLVARIKGVFRVGPKQWVMPAAAAAPAEQPGATVSTAADNAVDHPTANGTSSGGGSSSSLGLQLQEICYRGPSMVEVILCHTQQQLQQAAAAAAAVAGVLSTSTPPGMLPHQQGAHGVTPSCSTGSNAGIDRQHQGAAEAAAAAVQQLSVGEGAAQEAHLQGVRAGSCRTSGAEGEAVWLQLEAALRECLKPASAA